MTLVQTWNTLAIIESIRSTIADLRVRALGTDDDPRVGTLARPLRFMTAPALRRLYQVTVVGADNIPASGPAILSPNHLSFFDSPLLMTLAPRPVVFLGKAEYMDARLTKFVFPAFGMVPIRRDAKKASMAALTTAAGLLDEGRVVGIYPEGTRSRDGYLHRGHSGVAHLAMMSGAPIVPVGLIGTERVQPIGSALPRPFTGPLTVCFGEPIDPADYRYGGSRKRRHQLLDDVMAAIAAMTSQERSPDFSSARPPLIRGGSESVYRVTAHGATGLSWRHAAERAVADGSRKYDDARVGEVGRLRCRVTPSGRVEFETEIRLSTRFRAGSPTKAPSGEIDNKEART